MDRVLLGFKRHMIPVPWWLFQRLARRQAVQSRRAFGGLDDHQRRVHHYVVRELPRLAQPMSPETIASALDMPIAQVIAILGELERRMLFLFRPGGHDVEWAYPITVANTPHHVVFSTGERINAA